jgi:hypothetical protein
MDTITIGSDGSGSVALTGLEAGKVYGIRVRRGTARMGHVRFVERWTALSGDAGTALNDEEGRTYVFDLERTEAGGFTYFMVEDGTITVTVSGGTAGQTIHVGFAAQG